MTDREWTTETLLAYAAGELSPEENQRLESLIASDAAAKSVIERYQSVAEVFGSDDTVEPPASTIAAIHAFFERHHRQREATAAARPRPAWLDRLDALIGELLFDSRLQPIAVRRRHAAEFIQLAYRAGESEVELRATWLESAAVARPGRWRVLGQISPSGDKKGDAPANREVALVQAGSDAVAAESECDETGMFTLEAERGTYDLCFRLESAVTNSHRLVVLPGIELP